MYGIVNQGVKDLVLGQFGEDTWEQIRQKAGLEEEEFVRMSAYPDDITYALVGAATEVLGLSAEDILIAFGRHWVLFTAKEGYGDLLDLAGDRFVDFLHQLDDMHTRVQLSFPELRPPSFTCEERDDGSIRLHYHSHRAGLASLVVGMLHGLAERFHISIEIEHTPCEVETGAHDIFDVVMKESD